jgi:acetyl-CoA carboxylase biotin carboxyl carrier protein
MATELAAHITGTVWKIEKAVGELVAAGEPSLNLESMKMEVLLEAPAAGRVREVRCKASQAVAEGDTLVVLE